MDILGALFGSTKTNTPQVYQPQAPYLQYGFQQAKTNLQNSSNTPYYQGQTYAPLANGTGADVLANARSFLGGLGSTVPQDLSQAGTASLNGGAGYTDNANHIINGMFANPNGAMDMGNQFANSDVANGLVDASNRDVTRDLNENQLPGINRGAISGGNLNSSRAGALSGVAVRGAADREADNSAAIRGGLFNQGVGQYNTNTQNEIGANQQLYDALGFGDQASKDAFNAQGSANQNLENAASYEQADRQGQDTANFNQWQGQDQRLAQLLQQYWSIAGGQIGQNTGTTQTPGLISSLFGGGNSSAASGVGGALKAASSILPFIGL